ncbi:uncharacterized protein LOC132275463 [Cornus florida]|uniref:uncharacterized protein LOC132275463 n=1 Tax=Cornus florida TaxID=4283 RepID=UPI00289FFB81|nr:uncharacterized protein LOC132275463 [Cornus florida]
MDFVHEDVESLLLQTKHQEKQLKLKRRWLMGLPISNSEQKVFKGSKFPKDRTVPESLLREDDVYYETIKTFVEKGFEASAVKRDHHVAQERMQHFNLSGDERNLFSLLDHMTNKGLYVFAKMLTGGSTYFEKTPVKMKKIIRECLPKILGNRKNNHQVIMSKKISELLKDPHNFHRTSMTLLTPASQSYHAAAAKVLDGLEDFPFQTLSAMYRKLRCIQGYMPQLHPPKSGWGRSSLIKAVRKRSMKMLSELGEEDALQEPLVKAMAVAGLSLKLILGCNSVIEFQQFSQEIEALQKEIAKAIWLLKEKVSFRELKNLQLLLDPNTELSHRSLRTAVRNLLTEYLLECSDMDTIPGCLLETLSIINRSTRSAPRRFLSKKDIEEEVECVLSVSAQTKQIVWDLLPEHEFDQDYIDAYMEDLEESDDDYDDNDDQQQADILQNNRLSYPNDEIESTGETDPLNSNLPASSARGNGSLPVLTPSGRLNNDSMDSPSLASSTSGWESKVFDSPQNMNGSLYHLGSTRSSGLTEHLIDPAKDSKSVSSNFACRDNHKTSRNQYLAIQEACDETSIVAYHLIGRIQNEIAHIEGFDLDWDDISYLRGNDSIPKDSRVTKRVQISSEEDMRGSVIIRVLEELIPLFPKSGKECVKKLMGSN